ncbi:hypothetical protein HK097_010451 [Rhizophlyctis rosea]|uniref:Uncharacterized protein n=1 Tax=Rhizophlyctis rosea TaxID=64517 RepID=A0AAD5S7J8_9FUNG|nr:hypothetical protein HK097_010451 [Rhizophlyctis rosea]
MSKISPQSPAGALLTSDGITSSDAPLGGNNLTLPTDFYPSELPTLATGPLNSTGFFQTYDGSQGTLPAVGMSEAAPVTSLRERDAQTEEERRHEREERLKRLKAEEATKKKKRKII